MSVCFWVELCESKAAGIIKSSAARRDRMDGFPIMCQLLKIYILNFRQVPSFEQWTLPELWAWHRGQPFRIVPNLHCSVGSFCMYSRRQTTGENPSPEFAPSQHAYSWMKCSPQTGQNLIRSESSRIPLLLFRDHFCADHFTGDDNLHAPVLLTPCRSAVVCDGIALAHSFRRDYVR